jgi:hypothetical protein
VPPVGRLATSTPCSGIAITTATQTAALHRDAIAKVAELGASATVQEAYEGAEDTAALDDARDLAEEELTAAGVVADAVAAADAERGPLEVIGLLGSDLQEEAGAAVEALVDGQFDEATSQGNELIATRAGATTGGALRLGGAGVLILGGSGAVVLYRRRRARRAFDRQILSR